MTVVDFEEQEERSTLEAYKDCPELRRIYEAAFVEGANWGANGGFSRIDHFPDTPEEYARAHGFNAGRFIIDEAVSRNVDAHQKEWDEMRSLMMTVLSELEQENKQLKAKQSKPEVE